MNYRKIYDGLIQKRKDFPVFRKDQYCERHHIIPHCMSGSDKKENLIDLLAEEHFMAHYLLTKIYPENYSLLSAFVIMSGKEKYCGNKKYKKQREEYSKICSDTRKGSGNNMYGRNDQCYGQNGISTRRHNDKGKTYEEIYGSEKAKIAKEKQSKTRKGKEAKHLKGKTWEELHGKEKADRLKEEHSERISGKNHPNYGKHPKKIECEYCYLKVMKTNYIRWHGDKCKLKNI
jgi:hypothetical protein